MKFEQQSFPVLLRGAWFGLNKAFRRKLETISITPVQYTVLRNLMEGEGSVLSQQHLVVALSTNKNNLADLLNRMEEKKLIKRHGNKRDQRNKSVSITQNGEHEFRRAREHAQALEGEILSCFLPDEQDSLLQYFKRCNDCLEEISGID
tara:strand:- start:1351 stop:1797 length:447 start_codon:yes stop_codon:yes gene_type:complete